MIKSYLLWLVLSISYMPTIFAAPQQLPDDLLYGGKPIDTLCFFNQENTHTIDLKKCGIKTEKYNLKAIDSELNKKGYIGYDWSDPNTDSQGYSYYQIFAAGNHQYWIYTINNTGGSGDFTTLNLLRRTDPSTINIIQTIASGDRCNGGVQDVAVTRKNAVNFVINLTSYDLITLAHTKIKNLKAYDHLAACATCCAAKALYTVDNGLQLQLKYVELINFKDISELPTQGNYQNCFNQLFVSYMNKNELILNQEKIDEFVNQFSKTCLHQ